MHKNQNYFEDYFKDFELCWIAAEKRNGATRGRASDGALYGIKKTLSQEKCRFREIDDYFYLEIVLNSKIHNIVPVYLNCSYWQTDFNKLSEAMQSLGEKNCLLVGDFNARTGQDQCTTFENHDLLSRQSRDPEINARGRSILEMGSAFNLAIINGTDKGDKEGKLTFVRNPGQSVIDFLLMSLDCYSLLANFEVESQIYSDHMPLVTTLQTSERESLTDKANHLLPKLRWRENQAEAYKRNLDRKITEHFINNSETTIEDLQHIIEQSTAPPSTKTSKSKYHSPWYDRECESSRKKSFALLKIFQSDNAEGAKIDYLEANREYKTLCKLKKESFNKKQADKLINCKNSSDFWKAIQNIKGNNISINTQIPTSILRDHFMKLVNAEFCEHEIQYSRPAFQNDILDCDITLAEVMSTVSKLKENKAPGCDRIPNEFFKGATEELLNLLAGVYNNVFNSGIIPEAFKKSVIFPIFKKGDIMDPANYRNIAFLNSSLKIFMEILRRRLMRWIETTNLLSEFQIGFRKDYSTVDHIFTLTNIADTYLRRRKKLYVFFVDFRAAFDSINRKSLMYKLYREGMSLKFGSVIEGIYNETWNAVWNGINLSDWFLSTIGLKQGCSFSPPAFCLYIEDLHKIMPCGINFDGLQIKILMYADDIVLLAESPESLQLMINRLRSYCSEWNLTVNLNKSKTMVFRGGSGRLAQNEKWFYGQDLIETVKEYQYLGFTISSNLNIEKHLTKKLLSSKNVIGTVWKKVYGNQDLRFSSKYKVFVATSEAIMLYAAQSWGWRQYETTEKLLRYYLKRQFRLPDTTPNYMLFIETGLSPLYLTSLKLHFQYIIKLIYSPTEKIARKVAISIIKAKSSWFEEWKNLADMCALPFNLTLENLPTWKPYLDDLLEQLHSKHRADSIEQAKSSLHRETYSKLSYNLGQANYFSDDLTAENIQMIFRARGELLPLNFIPHRNDLLLHCSMCNTRERENVVHFLAKCPMLVEIRRQIWQKNYLNEAEVMEILNGEDWQKLIKFVKYALNYRKKIIREDF